MAAVEAGTILHIPCDHYDANDTHKIYIVGAPVNPNEVRKMTNRDAGSKAVGTQTITSFQKDLLTRTVRPAEFKYFESKEDAQSFIKSTRIKTDDDGITYERPLMKARVAKEKETGKYRIVGIKKFKMQHGDNDKTGKQLLGITQRDMQMDPNLKAITDLALTAGDIAQTIERGGENPFKDKKVVTTVVLLLLTALFNNASTIAGWFTSSDDSSN